MKDQYFVIVERDGNKELAAWYDSRNEEMAYKEARFQRKHGYNVEVIDRYFYDVKLNGFKVIEIKERER